MKGEPCGVGTLFLMPYRKVAHHCLFNLIIDPKKNETAIGAPLLNNLKHLAKTYFRLEILHAEVYEGNSMIKLLEGAGFSEFARQERFVKEGEGRYLARVLFACNL
ncbi:MAG: N-acetyltransferase, partial [Chlamydiales bacterium]